MRGRCDDVGIGDGARVNAGSNKPRNVRHIDHEKRPHTVRDLCKALEIDHTRVGRGARHDELRSNALRDALHLVIVDALGLGVDAVR